MKFYILEYQDGEERRFEALTSQVKRNERYNKLKKKGHKVWIGQDVNWSRDQEGIVAAFEFAEAARFSEVLEDE